MRAGVSIFLTNKKSPAVDSSAHSAAAQASQQPLGQPHRPATRLTGQVVAEAKAEAQDVGPLVSQGGRVVLEPHTIAKDLGAVVPHKELGHEAAHGTEQRPSTIHYLSLLRKSVGEHQEGQAQGSQLGEEHYAP